MAKSKKKTVRVSARMQEFLDGKLSVEDLTDEEIRRGQLMSDTGTFQGRPTDVIPRKFYDACVRENLRRFEKKVQEKLEPALKVLEDISNNPRLPADARYKSAVYLIERAAGKVPEKNEVKLDVGKWEVDLDALVYDDKPKKKKKDTGG